MKLIVFVFCFIPMVISAQNLSLIEDGKVWNMKTYPYSDYGGVDIELIYTGYSIEIKGDTMINDEMYNLVYYREDWFSIKLPNGSSGGAVNLNEPSTLIGCIREDSMTRKVYYISWASDGFPLCLRLELPTDQEILVYDFGIEVGDTMHYNFPTELQYVLQMKESHTLENGNETILYRFSGGAQWLEGIGGYDLDYGLLGPLLYTPFEGGCELSCVHLDSTYYIGGPGCDTIVEQPLSTELIKEENYNVNVFPIPARNELTISVDSESKFNYQIYDLRANSIWRTKKSNSNVIREDISVLEEGIYVLKVILENGRCSFHKFIKN